MQKAVMLLVTYRGRTALQSALGISNLVKKEGGSS